MKKTISLLLICALASVTSTAKGVEIPDSCITGKVVIVKKNVKGRCLGIIKSGVYHLESEQNDTYAIAIGQDCDTIPKTAVSKLETWSARDGHGFVYFMSPSKTKIMKSPSANSVVLAEKDAYTSDIPDSCPCLGLEGDWYKVELENGKTGYVSYKNVEWSICDPDCAGCIR